ncbi:hypothetical protein GOV09_00165, partial [Candidatus Woesearchaeota archaeon]|nr:hypothetical protein [Candidatus Woesearchaeota archaeon]
MEDDDEISIDFSKIKNIFKKKPKKHEEEQEHLKAEPEPIKADPKPEEKSQVEEKAVEEKPTVPETSSEKPEEKAPEDSDEISIDFSKIKNMFKKKDRPKTEVKETEEESDEVSFDFSKIKGFFKGLGKGQKDDDEVSFSFKKVKDFFKGNKEDEAAVDFKKVMGFMSKYKIILLILIPLILSIYLRAIPGDLPITDNWAEQSLSNSIRQQISNDVSTQYPNLPGENINAIINQQYVEFIKQNQVAYDQQLIQASDQFKSRLQKDGTTYLLAIDPYFWMRHARNVLENGHPGDELRDKTTGETCTMESATCVPWDTKMFAPVGREVPPDMFHAYATVFVHRFFTIFNPNRDLMATAFIMPILIASLCVIPAFFIARRISGNFGGLVAGLLVAVHPAFLTRTAGGFSDTDAYNVLFPLMAAWLFLEAFEAKSWKKNVLLSALAGIIVGIYTTIWGTGWWYIFDFLAVAAIGFIAIYLIINRNRLKEITKDPILRSAALVLITFFISTWIVSSMAGGLGTFGMIFSGATFFIKLKEVGITVWPNVFTTVAEQNPASLNHVVSQIGTGSLILFLAALLGIALTLIKKNSMDKKDLYYAIASVIWLFIIIVARPQNLILFLVLISLPIIVKILLAMYFKDREIDFKLAIMLIIWFTSTIYASTKGIRFTLLLVPAFSIGVGIAFGILVKYIPRVISKTLYLNRTLSKSVIIVLLFWLLIGPFNAGRATAMNEIPSMNDAWYDSLDRIDLLSEPDAIINSWWDFGHWFKAIGNRAVTFDGTSQNTPMAHWIGHTLLTNDEDKAIGILRMLDCGSNSAFDELDKDIKDTAISVQILHEVVLLDEDDAKDLLLTYVDEERAEAVLEFTHCDPPQNYYITSDDMIGKSGVWSHFGIWDFDRALIYNTLKQNEYRNDKTKSITFLKERFGFSDAESEQFYSEVRSISDNAAANSWISPWPSYASGVNGCSPDGDILICPIPVQGGTVNMNVDMENKKVEIITPQGISYPNSLVYPTEEGIEKLTFTNNTLGVGVTLFPQGNNWAYIMMA